MTYYILPMLIALTLVGAVAGNLALQATGSGKKTVRWSAALWPGSLLRRALISRFCQASVYIRNQSTECA